MGGLPFTTILTLVNVPVMQTLCVDMKEPRAVEM